MVLGVAVLLAQRLLLVEQHLLGTVIAKRVADLVVTGSQGRAVLFIQTSTANQILRFALLDGLIARFLR